MRQECVDAISKAMGRPFSSAEGDRMIGDIKAKMAALKRSDKFKDQWAQMSLEDRITEAGKAIVEDIRIEGERRKMNIDKNLLAQDRLTREQNRLAHEEDIHAYAGVAKILQNTYQYCRGIQNEFLSEMLDTLNGIKTKWLGFVEDAEDVKAFVQEAFGEDSGNEAAKAAWQAWSQTAEKMRVRAIRAGIQIGKLDYGYIPQNHSWVKVRKAGMEQWVRDVLPKLDRERYLNEAGNVMTDAELTTQVLEPAFRDIVTSGNPTENLFEIRNNNANRPRNGWNRDFEHRVLHFKDSDSFISYEKAYGEGSLCSTLIGHVSKLSTDIGIMEYLGPHPKDAFLMMKYTADGEAMNARIKESQWKLLTEYSDGMGLTRVSVEDMWNVLIGKANHAAPNQENVARFMSGFRNFEVMGKLGKAFITSLSDIPTYFIATGFNKLDVFQGVKFLARAYGKDWKEYANRMGFLADSIASDFNRWGNDNICYGWTTKLANATMKVSFLTAFTDATRRAFCLNMMAGIGKLIDTQWDLLSEYDRARLQDGGITETDWRIMQQAGTEDFNGVKFFSMEKLKALRQNSGMLGLFTRKDLDQAPAKVIGFVVKESEMASMAPDLVTRTETSRGLQRGTLWGEFNRCLFLFKSFPLAMMEKHWRRAQFLNRHAGNAVPYEYVAAVAVSTTVFGALSLQIQNLLNGKDLQDVGDSQFWLNAMAKGGGLGFLGDYLAYGVSEDSMYGAMTGLTNVAGPVAGTIVGASDIVTSAIKSPIYDKNTKVGAKTARFVRSHMPFMNVWYAATVIDRSVMDELQDYLSPGYSQLRESRLRRGTGQGYWWRPGELAPERMPEVKERRK